MRTTFYQSVNTQQVGMLFGRLWVSLEKTANGGKNPRKFIIVSLCRWLGTFENNRDSVQPYTSTDRSKLCVNRATWSAVDCELWWAGELEPGGLLSHWMSTNTHVQIQWGVTDTRIEPHCFVCSSGRQLQSLCSTADPRNMSPRVEHVNAPEYEWWVGLQQPLSYSHDFDISFISISVLTDCG